MTNKKYQQALSDSIDTVLEGLAKELAGETDPTRMTATNTAVEQASAVFRASFDEARSTVLASRLAALDDAQSILGRRARRISRLLATGGTDPEPGPDRAIYSVRVLSRSNGKPLPGVAVELELQGENETTMPAVTTTEAGVATWALDAVTLRTIGNAQLRAVVQDESGNRLGVGESFRPRKGSGQRVELSVPTQRLPAAQARADRLAASIEARTARYAARRAELRATADLAAIMMAGDASTIVVDPDHGPDDDRAPTDGAKYGVARPLAAIEGVGPRYAGRLEEAGVRDTLDLVRAGQTPEARARLVEQSGISARLLEKWFISADLQRVEGIDGRVAELLREAGIDSVEALAEAADLGRRVALANARLELLEEAPSATTLEKWSRTAAQLGRPAS